MAIVTRSNEWAEVPEWLAAALPMTPRRAELVAAVEAAREEAATATAAQVAAREAFDREWMEAHPELANVRRLSWTTDEKQRFERGRDAAALATVPPTRRGVNSHEARLERAEGALREYVWAAEEMHAPRRAAYVARVAELWESVNAHTDALAVELGAFQHAFGALGGRVAGASGAWGYSLSVQQLRHDLGAYARGVHLLTAADGEEG